jgi:hypothetical protein
MPLLGLVRWRHFSSMPMKSLKSLRLQAAVLLTAMSHLQAAPITWGPATAISNSVGNSSDVSTNGTLMEAFSGRISGNPSTNQTVNGVLFTPTTNLHPNDNVSNLEFSASTNSGDLAYHRILSSADFGGGNCR